MTTPKPERMTDAAVDEDVMFLGRLLPEVACQALARISCELRCARDGEAKAIRGMAEALAERNSARSGEEQAGRERDGYREAARRLRVLARNEMAMGAILEERAGKAEAERDESRTALDEMRAKSCQLYERLEKQSAELTRVQGAEAWERDRAETAERERHEARRERDAAQVVAKEAGRQLGEVGAAKLEAECERDLARAEVERLKAMLDEVRCQRDGALEHVAKLEAQIDRMRCRIRELEEHHG